ncbi:hypothetical protein [Bradyrhizobium sp. NBAIM08]|uniref:hypothetical protein n=1 Tax=Bradyrhizobium sp. NBAIM08 TaxID=2793815 RepID=UPI0034D175E5
MLLAAEDSTGQIFGTVQMVPAGSESQMHSAQVVKLLVGRSARRRGIGRWLLSAGKDIVDAQHDHKFCCRASLRQRRMAAGGVSYRVVCSPLTEPIARRPSSTRISDTALLDHC